MRLLSILFFALATVAPGFAADPEPVRSASGKADQARALHALFDAEWERRLRENPLLAVYYGDPRFNDRLPDLSPEAVAASKAADRAALKTLHRIERDVLSASDRLNYDVFEWELVQAILGHDFRPELIPLNQRGGIQTFDEILELLPMATVKDYEDWLSRLGGFGTYMDQTIALMQAGVEAGLMPPRVVMERIPAQIALQAVESPEQSRFWRAFEKMPETIPAADRQRLRERGRTMIAEQVLPAYRRLQAFFNDIYLPATPENIAARALPNGEAYYAHRANYFTTTDLSPEQIHQIGLEEVARIRGEMEAIRSEVGFEGDLAAFFHYLRTDPKFFYDSPAALLTAYQAMAKRIDPELVKVFRTIPRMPYGIRAIPDHIAPDTTTAYYQPAAADGSRAGFHYVNLYRPETRPKWEMMALSLHEAVPGHHFQFALGLEMPEQPMFRRTAYIVAYGEGWALYAERLGHEMGLYDDPYDRFGQLTYDMWRAVRLVVDTGMHFKGWSRQQGIDYFMANAPKTEQDVVNEIDRYIAWPGQALAYKIGQLKISELRERAASALGDRFDLKIFHEVVLGTGSVPLTVLEAQVDAWIAEQRVGE
jgi:uncharacterized protein (DUF885 family)